MNKRQSCSIFVIVLGYFSRICAFPFKFIHFENPESLVMICFLLKHKIWICKSAIERLQTVSVPQCDTKCGLCSRNTVVWNICFLVLFHCLHRVHRATKIIRDHIDYNQTYTFLPGHLGQKASNPSGTHWSARPADKSRQKWPSSPRRWLSCLCFSWILCNTESLLYRPLQNISILDSGGNPMTDVTLLHYNKPYLDRDWMKWRELTGVICGKL